jgi:hypothetical protein
VLNDTSIISFQISVGPCKNILIFSEKFEIGLPFFFRYCLAEIYILRVLRVPRLIVSYMGQELPVFVFVDPLNLSLKSKRFSKLATPFGIV